MKYFLQANEQLLQKSKIRVNDNNVSWCKSEIQLGPEVSWKKERNEFGDDFDNKLHKDGSIQSHDRRFNLKLQALFGKIISKVNLENL